METQFKVGQPVMIVGNIISISDNDNLPIRVRTKSHTDFTFTADGKFLSRDTEPCLFPYTEPFKEREMLVSNMIDALGEKRTVVSNFNGMFQTKSWETFGVANWKFAKEIEEPKPEELTQEEIKAQIKELVRKLK